MTLFEEDQGLFGLSYLNLPSDIRTYNTVWKSL